jgi:hypothetical protein
MVPLFSSHFITLHEVQLLALLFSPYQFLLILRWIDNIYPYNSEHVQDGPAFANARMHFNHFVKVDMVAV